MESYSGLIIFVLFVILFIFWYSQTKFKNKMLCYFLRPNKQRIKKWVPVYGRHVVFDRGKYGIERYRIIPRCIIHEWYNGGVNKLFPTLVPTLDFRWDTPNPKDPSTGETFSWKTPEVEASAYQGHGYTAFAKAATAQAGLKRNKLMELIPLIILGILIIGMFFLYNNITMIQEQVSWVIDNMPK